MRRLVNWFSSGWLWPLIFILAITGAFIAENVSLPCCSPNNLERRQPMCIEIDHELSVVCYWAKGHDDISCVPLNQTNYKEERSER